MLSHAAIPTFPGHVESGLIGKVEISAELSATTTPRVGTGHVWNPNGLIHSPETFQNAWSLRQAQVQGHLQPPHVDWTPGVLLGSERAGLNCNMT